MDFGDGTYALVRGIYKTTIKLGQLPVKIATPYVLKYKIKKYLKDIPVSAEVKKRINKRLGSKQFVDGVIPFLWSLKEQYQASSDGELEKF